LTRARALLRQQLRRPARGSTLFLTSHALADVESCATAWPSCTTGQIRFSGTPAECRAQYGAPRWNKPSLPA
jgi:ABC-2 type transport system ATP-binding protein